MLQLKPTNSTALRFSKSESELKRVKHGQVIRKDIQIKSFPLQEGGEYIWYTSLAAKLEMKNNFQNW